jgi:hypothetical protein
MNYCIVNQETQIIENIIVCENDEIAKQFNAVPSYANAKIGGKYDYVPEPTEMDKLQAQVTYTALITDTLITSEGK